MTTTTSRRVQILVDTYDTVLKSWAWDVISLSRNSQPIWQFSKLPGIGPVRLGDTFGAIVMTEMTLDPQGRVVVVGIDTSSGKQFQPTAAVSPINSAPIYFLLKAQLAQGQRSTQSTTGQNKTDPTYSVTASLAAKLGLKIFGTGVETTGTAGATRNSTSTTNSIQSQTTTNEPTQIVLGLELHRTMHLPDLSMLPPADSPKYG